MTVDERQAVMPQAVIDEGMLEAMRAKAGAQLRIDHSVNNEEATRIAILRFAGGIGDPNPLWTDPDYAATSPYGGLVAPPSFVIGCFSGIQFGWPGLGAFHSNSDLEFERPVRLVVADLALQTLALRKGHVRRVGHYQIHRPGRDRAHQVADHHVHRRSQPHRILRRDPRRGR